MREANKTNETIIDAARAALEGRTLRKVLVQQTADSEGEDALDVMIVLDDADLSGPEAARILVSVQTALAGEGDDRFPIITFTTEEELALDGDPES